MRKNRYVRSIALVTTLLTTTAACGAAGSGSNGRPEAIGSFYPMAWLAERVGGDAVAVRTLTAPGTEPHDLELTPRQIVDVGEARFVVYVKGVQPAVDEAVKQHAADHALDAASVVTTLPAPETGHEHEEEPGHEGEAVGGTAEPGHTEEVGYDPHLWLDPSRLATVATTLGERLAATDTAGAASYRTRAATVAAELTTLDEEFRASLRDCQHRTMVTAHAAFGYLADRYDLTQVPIASLDPGSEPSPNRLAELTREVRASGVSTVFTETLVSPAVTETLARELGVHIAVLDPIEGLAEGSSDDYLSIMRRNLQTLRTALECA